MEMVRVMQRLPILKMVMMNDGDSDVYDDAHEEAVYVLAAEKKVTLE